jgi:uncharacterized protein (TIGR00106 family)
MSVLLNFAMFPTDKGSSVSQYVSRVIGMIDKSGVVYKLNSMGTTIETETMQEALSILQQAHDQLIPDCERIYCTVTMDIRKGKDNRMTKKIESVENHIGKVKK